jgi:hypothetical protein
MGIKRACMWTWKMGIKRKGKAKALCFYNYKRETQMDGIPLRELN